MSIYGKCKGVFEASSYLIFLHYQTYLTHNGKCSLNPHTHFGNSLSVLVSTVILAFARVFRVSMDCFSMVYGHFCTVLPTLYAKIFFSFMHLGRNEGIGWCKNGDAFKKTWLFFSFLSQAETMTVALCSI